MKLYLGLVRANALRRRRRGRAATIARDLSRGDGRRGATSTLLRAGDFGACASRSSRAIASTTLPIAIDALRGRSVGACARRARRSSETLRTDLFRSVCPVTGQPDYASIAIAYRGPRIDRAGLLRYLVSYRLHAGLPRALRRAHLRRLWRRCALRALTVYARFTRRGGIDINPFRTNAGVAGPGERAHAAANDRHASG